MFALANIANEHRLEDQATSPSAILPHMLMVIFGAGASFDSSSTYTIGTAPPGASQTDRDNDYYRLPLAKDLFANRPSFIEAINAFPQCKTIVPRLRDPAVTSGNASIETRLQEIEEEAKTYIRGQQELAAVRCYLQLAIARCESDWRSVTKAITNQLLLLREIQRTHKGDDPVCLVTFNYDTLLEDALAELRLEIKEMKDYTRSPTLFKLFKLHGSVDWGRRVQGGLPGNVNAANPHSVLTYLVNRGLEDAVTNYFARCDPSTMRPPDEPNTVLFPAIAIPVEKKQVFECPQDMLDDLKKLLPRVTKILVIGWRATEDNFLDLLKEHLQWGRGLNVYIVSANETEAQKTKAQIEKAVATSLRSSPETAVGFREFMRSRRPQEILAG
jgi:SIR2-like protein